MARRYRGYGDEIGELRRSEPLSVRLDRIERTLGLLKDAVVKLDEKTAKVDAIDNLIETVKMMDEFLSATFGTPDDGVEEEESSEEDPPQIDSMIEEIKAMRLPDAVKKDDDMKN